METDYSRMLSEPSPIKRIIVKLIEKWCDKNASTKVITGSVLSAYS